MEILTFEAVVTNRADVIWFGIDQQQLYCWTLILPLLVDARVYSNHSRGYIGLYHTVLNGNFNIRSSGYGIRRCHMIWN